MTAKPHKTEKVAADVPEFVRAGAHIVNVNRIDHLEFGSGGLVVVQIGGNHLSFSGEAAETVLAALAARGVDVEPPAGE